jgi:outer membrane receptor protein involved in Fe transport
VAAGHISTAAAENANSPAQLGKVTVTGTRIKRTNIATAQPITRISHQQIQQSGYSNLGQILGHLSFAAGFLNTSYNNGGNGETLINLRNLGASRNLVLVNGKRWIPTLGGATNLNTIPTSIIDHVEILQDGASAIYGSDAIAGVINVITVKNFNGAEAHARYAIRNDHKTGRWDGQEKQYDFTVGAGNDRGNVVFNATYKEQNAIPAYHREISKEGIIDLGKAGGSSTNSQGHFQLFGPRVGGATFGSGQCGTFDPKSPTKAICNLTLQNVPAAPSLSNFKDFGTNDTYNYAPDNYLQTPLKDVSLYTQGHYDLFDNVTFTANAAYIRDEATTTLASEPINIGSGGANTVNGNPIGISGDNPYNPFGVDLVADSSDPCIAAGTCVGLNVAARRMVEGGNRTSDINRDYFHIFAGFNGYFDLFSREIDWDVGFAQNRVQRTTLQTGSYNTLRLSNALGPAAQCTSPCVPLNFFGGAVEGDGGSITPAMIDYLTFEAHNVRQVNLRDWTANLSSDIIDLPAGPLGMAVGYERLDNYGYFHPDALVSEGNTTGNANSPTNGRVVRDAEYAELNIPLIADVPGVKSLSVDVANRWTQYKRSGGLEGQNVTSFVHNSSGRLNIRWQVINDLLLRASWAQAFRSPSVSELFGGQFDTFVGVSDPCAPGKFGGYTGGPLPSNCPGGTLDIQNNSQIHSTGGGNPDVQPETAISRTVGFVYSPSQVPGLDINADYYKIELSQAITSVGFQNILSGCFENGTFCNQVTVRGGQVVNIVNVQTNVGGLLTEGIDVGLHYKFPTTPIGDFDARINGTFLKVFNKTNVNLSTKTGFATSHLAGIDKSSSAYPKRKFSGYLDWDYGNWSAQYHIQYIDGVSERCILGFECTHQNPALDFQGAPSPYSRNHLGATVYHDISVAYTAPLINTTFRVGVNNIFDKKPPISRQNVISNNYDTADYRLPSRFLYGDITVRF